jgi:hypothetical protein
MEATTARQFYVAFWVSGIDVLGPTGISGQWQLATAHE